MAQQPTKQSSPTRPSPWPTADKAVAVFLMGQRFSNDRLHYVSRILLILSIALIISVIGNIAMFPNPPRYRYLPIGTNGVVLPQVPMTESNHDDKFVVDWTVDAVTRLYSFDFLNYREQLQDARKNLTTTGWDSFQKSMRDSNNFEAILGNSFVLTAVPTGAGKVVKTGLLNDRYTWKVVFPMLISYRSSSKDTPGGNHSDGRIITDTLNMTVTVTRVGVFLNETGLGIKSIVATR